MARWIRWGNEAVRIPGVAGRLGREPRNAVSVQAAGQLEDALRGRAAPVQKDADRPSHAEGAPAWRIG
jgi:hypothetical protein